jgi:hypothetical protein
MKPFAWVRERPILILWLLGVLLLLAGGGMFLWVSGHRHRINQESVAKIERGMTEQQVEEILGVPEGDYGDGEFGEFELLTPKWDNPDHNGDSEQKIWYAQ